MSSSSSSYVSNNTFMVDICESYSNQEIIDYAKRINLFTEKKSINDLCCQIRLYEFISRFYYRDVNITNFQGSASCLYSCLLYLQSLCFNNVDIFCPPQKSFDEKKITFPDLGIVWSVEKEELSHIIFHSEVADFINQSTKQFVIIVFGLEYTIDFELQDGHANLLIFDRSNKTIERFEPLGTLFNHRKYLPQTIDTTLPLLFQNYTYIAPSIKFGPQIIQNGEMQQTKNDPKGFCISWIMWYIEFRFSYKHLYSQTDYLELYLKILNNNGINFTQFIRNYSEYILSVGKKLRK